MVNPIVTRGYHLLPCWAQNLALSAWGLQSKKTRYGKEFHRKLAWLEESQWWGAQEIEAFQTRELRRVVRLAYEQIPAYHRHMKEKGITPNDISTSDDLRKLPIITKHDVRAGAHQYRNPAISRRHLINVRTSGTTGTPLSITLTRDALQFQWAVWWRHRARFNLRLGDKFLMFGARLPLPQDASNPPYWRYNHAINQVYLSTYHLTPSTIPQILEWLNREDFAFFTGYPSAMYVLANFLREHGATLNRPPRRIVAGSDALIPAFERVIRESFGAPVTDQYGSAEACGNFAQCELGKYHLDAEFCMVELLPVEGADNGRLRRLVFTGFANPAMPFIRYDQGDLGLLSERPCTCGRHTLTLDRIEGRTEDFVRTPDGRMAIGMNQVFEWAPHLIEAQIRQDRIDAIDVLIVPGKGYSSADELILEEQLRARLGREIAIDYHLVDSIPRAMNGKFRAVVSTIAGKTDMEHQLQSGVSDGLI